MYLLLRPSLTAVLTRRNPNPFIGTDSNRVQLVARRKTLAWRPDVLGTLIINHIIISAGSALSKPFVTGVAAYMRYMPPEKETLPERTRASRVERTLPRSDLCAHTIHTVSTHMRLCATRILLIDANRIHLPTRKLA